MHHPRSTRPGQHDGGWVRVDQLPPLARALLNDALQPDADIPAQLAARVTEQARQWQECGCDEQTVRRWKHAGVPPAVAQQLAARHVSPDLLSLPVDTVTGVATDTLDAAITAGRISVERAYELLVATGLHSPPQPSPQRASATREDPRRPVAPLMFSHPEPLGL